MGPVPTNLFRLTLFSSFCLSLPRQNRTNGVDLILTGKKNVMRMEKSAVISDLLSQYNVAAPRSPQTILPLADSNSFLFTFVETLNSAAAVFDI